MGQVPNTTNYTLKVPNQSKRSTLLVNKAVYVRTYPVLGKTYSYTYTFYVYVQRVLTCTRVNEREEALEDIES